MKTRILELLTPRSLKTPLLGAAVASLALLGQTDILSNISGAFNDKDVMVRWSSVLSGATRQAIPVTIIDVDDATLARVGGVDRTPRDLVSGLVSLAAEKRAAGIVVDIDTSRPGPDPAADKALIDLVSSYPAGAPMLMYARRFIDANGKTPATELDLSPLSSILDESAANRHNVIAVSSVAPLESDRVIRRWQLSQTACNGAEGQSFASPQLVALALRENGAAARASVDAFLSARTAQRCAGSTVRPAWPRNPDVGASIWFLFGANPSEAPITMVEADGARVPLVRHIPAHTLLGADGGVAPSRAISEQIFAGRFVVIGSSHIESFDNHITPLGPMPGAFIVANTIASSPATLSAARIPPLARMFIAMGIFVLLAMITAPLRALVAAIAVVCVMIVLLALMGRIMAPSSALQIALTSTALLALFSGLNSLYETGDAMRRIGWRAILKHPPAGAAQQPAPSVAPRQGEGLA